MAGWQRAYELVKRIPGGRVVTYGQLARWLRLRGGARAAGHAMAACPSRQGVPWHRVVGADGFLRIREPLVSLQRRLLESEGVRVVGGRVDLERHQWTPAKFLRRAQPRPAQRKARLASRE
jgi:methylated-DNA-protein-cysteine methyltransferase-like protein